MSELSALATIACNTPLAESLCSTNIRKRKYNDYGIGDLVSNDDLSGTPHIDRVRTPTLKCHCPLLDTNIYHGFGFNHINELRTTPDNHTYELRTTTDGIKLVHMKGKSNIGPIMSRMTPEDVASLLSPSMRSSVFEAVENVSKCFVMTCHD